jgi:hypothetical protein
MAYVYRHIRLDKNEPFYIGIGYDKNYSRANETDSRNKYWKNVVNLTEYKVEIILDDLNNDEVKLKEIEFIALYGRKNKDGGILVNMTDGGEGTKGYKHSEETKRKIAESNRKENISEENRLKKSIYAKNRTAEHKEKLRQSNIGRILSDESKLKMSLSHLGKKIPDSVKLKMSQAQKGRKHSEESKIKMKENCHLSKLVLNTETGIYYNSSTEAAFSHCLNPRTMYKYMAGKCKRKTSLKYV